MFPESLPERFPEETGLSRGLWMLAHEEHIHNHQIRPRLKEAVTLSTIEVGEPEESHEISWPAFQKLPTSLKTSIKDEKNFSATVIKSERPDGRQYQLPDKR